MSAKSTDQADMKKTVTKEFLKYEFTREEKEQFASELARNLSELDQQRLKKKEVVKSIDSEIATGEAQVSKLASFVKDGYEYRNIECDVFWNYEARIKTIYRTDTGEKVRTIPMTANELQDTLFGEA
jgi:hypothetical protein